MLPPPLYCPPFPITGFWPAGTIALGPGGGALLGGRAPRTSFENWSKGFISIVISYFLNYFPVQSFNHKSGLLWNIVMRATSDSSILTTQILLLFPKDDVDGREDETRAKAST
mmetsp:Transcript_5100/g.7313  ORF Transcript_5100/g.7313 Transcript_5100/m.7313 type:complete len:113 (+) Transcript_5100:239-577(+)